jgi:hypothetical protein
MDVRQQQQHQLKTLNYPKITLLRFSTQFSAKDLQHCLHQIIHFGKWCSMLVKMYKARFCVATLRCSTSVYIQ